MIISRKKFMDKNLESIEEPNFEFVPKEESNDYESLLEKLKSIKKSLTLLENTFIK